MDDPADTGPKTGNASMEPREPDRSREALLRQAIDSLTAIREYAAGARRALDRGAVTQVDRALGRIDAQVTRTHDVLSILRRRDEQRSS